jgi:hypothetical protein
MRCLVLWLKISWLQRLKPSRRKNLKHWSLSKNQEVFQWAKSAPWPVLHDPCIGLTVPNV